MKRSSALLLVFVLLSSSGCTAAGSGDVAFAADVPRASAAPSAAVAAAGSISAIGIDLYRRVGADGGNVVISPASVALALAMARTGARGETAKQMDDVLRGVGSDVGAAGLNALDRALTSRSGTFSDVAGTQLPVTLQIANTQFAQRGLALAPAFLDALASRFGAGVRLVDYRADPEAARRLINSWVRSRTEGKIPELIGSGVLSEATRLTLVNAIYLKAPWRTPFAEGATAPGSFVRADGTTVNVPMMALGASLPYAAGSGWRAVELPYVGGSLALTVIVPDDLARFEATLTPALIAQISDALAERQVSLTLPKFSIRTSANLKDGLSALGMPLAFEPGLADFSGMTTQERLYISAVIHQAAIDVDEKGTEASAATAVVAVGTAMPADPILLKVDRPFLFALRDIPTGAILFLGRVADPSAAK